MLQTSGKVATTLRSLPSATFNFGLTAPSYSDVRWTGEVALPSGTIGTSYMFAGNAKDFTSSAKLSTPYRGYERFEVDHVHSGGMESPITKVCSDPDMLKNDLFIKHIINFFIEMVFYAHINK